MSGKSRKYAGLYHVVTVPSECVVWCFALRMVMVEAQPHKLPHKQIAIIVLVTLMPLFCHETKKNQN